MAKARRRTKRNARRAALALGAAGVSLAMTGGSSATAPTNVAPPDNARRIFLGEEEIGDVSLATFHVFDKETEYRLRQGIRVAAGHGGCGGCGHGGGCGGCAHGGGCGCAAHMGGGCAHVGGCGCAHVGGYAGQGCRGCAGGGCGCRGCGGCALGGFFLGITCLGCAACTGSCWQWDPYLGRWISVCY